MGERQEFRCFKKANVLILILMEVPQWAIRYRVTFDQPFDAVLILILMEVPQWDIERYYLKVEGLS